jgi:hypothetical protein
MFARVFRGGNHQTEKIMGNQSLKLLNQTTVATQHDNRWLEAAEEAGGGFGKLLKFNKGDWLIGEDAVPEGKEFIAFIDEVARGYVRFEDKTVTDRRIVKVRDGHPPKRDELGDDDESLWEVDENTGKPRDPWVLQWLLPMAAVDAEGDLVVFVTSSKGGMGAIGNLCRIYGRSQRNGLLPIVALKTAHYKHPEWGKIAKPDLPIVGMHGVAEPPTKPAGDGKPWDDEIPFVGD